MFRALRHSSFRLLWASMLGIQLGHWFISIAFQWVLPHRSEEDSFLLGVLFFCTFTPYLLFSLPAGALADSRDRRRILIGTQLGAFTLGLVATGLSITDQLAVPIVLLLGFLSGCVVTVVSPANQALTANTVPAEDLSSAIPLQAASINLARIIGPALGGPALLIAGASGAFAVYTAIGLTALILLTRVTVAPRALPPRVENVLTRVRAGFAHARSRPPTGAALATVAITSLFGCAFQSQLPILGSRIADDGDTAFLLLLVASGIGSLVAVLTIARRTSPPRLPTIALLLIGLGLTVAGMGSVRWYPGMMLLSLVSGGLVFAVMTSANTLVQHLIDDAQRGRVMSLYFLCWGGLLPFGGLGIGALGGVIGMELAFAAFGGIAAIGGAVIGWRHRGMRLDRRE